MLSVCGSIYRDKNFLCFMRSLLDKASRPDVIEFVVVDDEAGSETMARCFDDARTLTKNLRVIPVTKEDRVAHVRRCLSFYAKERIFPANHLDEFAARLSDYEAGKMDRLWLAPGRNYNLAVSAAVGDTVLHTPLDLQVECDVSAAYYQFVAAKRSRRHLCVRLGLVGTSNDAYHGIQMFNRGLFDAMHITDTNYSDTRFAFDERWFIRAFVDDDWNHRADALGAGGAHLGWRKFFGKPMLLSMPDGDWSPAYLYRDYGDWPVFEKCVRVYLRRRGT